MRATTKAAGIALALIAAGITYHHATETTMTCTVTSKQQIYSMDGQAHSYRLHTTCGVLDIDDVLLYGAWDPRSLYRSIDTGGTYQLTTTAGFPGSNPVVVGAEPAD